MKKTGFWLLLIIMTISACKRDETESDTDQKLTVAIAASTQYAMEAIKQAFERSNSTNVELIVSSSGKLTAQILQGAPYDVFVSADMNYPDTLNKANLTTTTPVAYAYGTLVMWTCKDIDLSTGIRVLTEPQIKKIAIANPKTAPYGAETMHALSNLRVYDAELNDKLVYGESIAQTNQYITSGNCEVGFTAKSVVMSPEMRGKGKWVEIKPISYQPIAQGMVITMQGIKQHPKGSVAFYNFLLSEKGREILEAYGYQLPDLQFEPTEK